MNSIRAISPQLGWLVVALMLFSAPVAARTVADFARDAHRVDGRHAVGAGATTERRAGKLVATDPDGFLPNGIIQKAPLAQDSRRLGGRTAEAYTQQCGEGALRGEAIVPPDVGAAYEDVAGFATTHGGPVDRSGSNCHISTAEAKKIAVGVYRVKLALVIFTDCTDGSLPDDILGITLGVIASEPLVATYRPVCEDNNQVVAEVNIVDLNGLPRDSAFSIALFEENGVPIP